MTIYVHLNYITSYLELKAKSEDNYCLWNTENKILKGKATYKWFLVQQPIQCVFNCQSLNQHTQESYVIVNSYDNLFHDHYNQQLWSHFVRNYFVVNFWRFSSSLVISVVLGLLWGICREEWENKVASPHAYSCDQNAKSQKERKGQGLDILFSGTISGTWRSLPKSCVLKSPPPLLNTVDR